jgi:hypothetical protein
MDEMNVPGVENKELEYRLFLYHGPVLFWTANYKLHDNELKKVLPPGTHH